MEPEPGEFPDGVDIIEGGDAMLEGTRSRADLQAQAKSVKRMLTHIPKNPYRHACSRAKLTAKRYPSRSGSARNKAATTFGDVVTIQYHAIAVDPSVYG